MGFLYTEASPIVAHMPEKCPMIVRYDRSLLRQLDQTGRVNRSSSSAMQCNQGNYYLINLSFPSMCHKVRGPWT